jgi:hypothetical protein
VNASLLYTLNGYNANDITAKAAASWNLHKDSSKRNTIGIQVDWYQYEADYFYAHYFANSYSWTNNSFKKQQNFRIGLEWIYDHYQASLNYYVLNNKILIGEDLTPVQLVKAGNIIQFATYIPFRYKGFGFDVNTYVQYCDHNMIPMPWLATMESLFYGFNMFKKALFLQLGLEMSYNSPYYAYAYNPVMQQFYYQDDKKIGNYVYLDFFANVKVSRFYFHFVVGNFLSGVFPANYYLVPHYPAKGLHFKAGASWRFHD